MKPFVREVRKEGRASIAIGVLGLAFMLAALYDERAYLLVYALLAVGYVRGLVLRRREARSQSASWRRPQ